MHTLKYRGVALAAVAALAGCAPDITGLVEPDVARGGALGKDGPRGAVLVQRDLRVRGDRVVAVDIIAASRDGDTIDTDLTPVLLVQGGSVPVERYRWLATHLATRGAVVVMPRFLSDLAFFDQADAADGLAAARSASDLDGDVLAGVLNDRAALAVGHSLGGVVAASAFDYDHGIGALALLASYADPGSPPTRTDGQVLMLRGENDGLVERSQIVDGAAAFKAPVVAADVVGLTHFQMTDEATDAEIQREGTTGDDLAIVRPRLLFLLDALFSDVSGGPDGDILDDDSIWPTGLTAVEQP